VQLTQFVEVLEELLHEGGHGDEALDGSRHFLSASWRLQNSLVSRTVETLSMRVELSVVAVTFSDIHWMPTTYGGVCASPVSFACVYVHGCRTNATAKSDQRASYT
jgi:hypothetical protein